MLLHIKTETCPTCGAAPVAERIETRDGVVRRHCNGQAFEHRTFACGAEIAFVPNYSAERQTRPCPHESAQRIREEKRIAAGTALSRALATLDVDADFKAFVERQIGHAVADRF